MRDFAARKFLDKRPEAKALYALVAPEPRLEVRAAAADKPAEILIYDEIGYWGVTAKDFTKALIDAGEGPIVVRINSPGGDVFDGIAIHNAIKQRGNVTAVVDGVAASAASFIMIAADTVSVHEAAMVFVHKAWGFTVGNEDDHLEQAITLGKIDGVLASMYAEKTGKPVDDMSAVMRAETWFTSSEALAAGLVDEVLKAPEKPAARAAGDMVIVAAIEPEDPAIAEAAARTANQIAIRQRLLRLAEVA